MSNCKYCGQEIIQEHFEGEIDICTDCIMTSSRIYGLKFASLSCLIVILSIMFIINLISIIMNIPVLITNFEEHIIYSSIPIAVSIITGSSFLWILLYLKKIKI
ncbi:MAG: hypothetical protein KGD73_05105 [Candidatus Lokiarchaeota archaeon]|nr:hypothetical protein [Candidatus Lokiarchaeota archaeon]